MEIWARILHSVPGALRISLNILATLGVIKLMLVGFPPPGESKILELWALYIILILAMLVWSPIAVPMLAQIANTSVQKQWEELWGMIRWPNEFFFTLFFVFIWN